jgi:vitamin B12 transporter
VAYVFTDAQDARAGDALLRRPRHYWRASLALERGAFKATLSWTREGERRDELYGDDGFGLGVGEAPAYELARLSLSYDLAANAQVYLTADNLTDQSYEPVNGFAGAPRSVAVGVRSRF